MGKIIQYMHHNWKVSVDEALKGTHREHCLCFRCDIFAPQQNHNCVIAQGIFKICQERGLTLPVFECPYYKRGIPDLSGLVDTR